MADYYFHTQATMKEYNQQWNLDMDCVGDKFIEADNLKEALEEYAIEVQYEDYVSISKNALRHKSPMYIDDKDGRPKQIGYVLTGKAEFEHVGGKWVEQYIELWVEITDENDDIISFPDHEL